MLNSRSWRFVAGAAVVCLVAGTVWAQGQQQPGGGRQPGQRARDRGQGGGGGPGGMGGGMFRNALEKPAINPRNLETAMHQLALSKDQQDAVHSLMDGYQGEADRIAEEIRKGRQSAMEAMRDEGPEAAQDAWKKVGEDQKKWRAEREKIDTGLMNDIQAVLTKEQGAGWESARRQVVRAQSLRQGLLSGERVDVLVLVNQLDLVEKDRDQVKPILEQYELDVDREIAERDRVTNDAMNSFDPSQFFDPEKRQDLTKRLEARRAASEKVRDVNNRYAKQVEAALPDGPRGQFDKAFHEASFPEVYRQTQAGRALAAAEGFDDLSTDQRLGVADLRDRYDAKMVEMHPRMEQAALDMEKNFSIAGALGGFGQRGGGNGPRGGNGGQGGGNQPDAQRALRQERRELDDKFMADLKKILSEDQAARLPEPEQQDQPRRRGGGGSRANSPDGA